MSASKKSIQKKLDELESASDVGYQLEELIMDASDLGDTALMQSVLDKGKELAGSHYKANIVVLTCMAKYFDKKEEALSSFWSNPLDPPEEFDDVYTDACNLLEECGCSEDEVGNLRRDAEAMFDENGVYQPDWMDKL
jgi:hypothetical protein